MGAPSDVWYRRLTCQSLSVVSFWDSLDRGFIQVDVLLLLVLELPVPPLLRVVLIGWRRWLIEESGNVVASE